jgi:lysophospholipase L1-like esterase
MNENRTIALYGDSRIANAPWWYISECNVENYGISGASSRKYLETINPASADISILSIGINDSVDEQSDEQSVSNIQNIVDKLSLCSDRIIFITPPGTNPQKGSLPNKLMLRNEKAKRINALLLGELAGVAFIDGFSLLSDDDGYLAEKYTTDGVHFNSLGYSTLLHAIELELATSRPPTLPSLQ